MSNADDLSDLVGLSSLVLHLQAVLQSKLSQRQYESALDHERGGVIGPCTEYGVQRVDDARCSPGIGARKLEDII